MRGVEIARRLGRRGRYGFSVYGRTRQRRPLCGAQVGGRRFHGRPTFFGPVGQR